MRRPLSAAIAIAIASLLVVPAASGWSWPVDGAVLRPYSLGPDTYAAGQHRGIDVGAAVRESVRAPAGGVVSFVGPVPAGGRAVTIQTGDGYAVTLLQLNATEVVRGGTVTEGQVVGRVGESADPVTAAPHVHLGIRISAEADGYLDPVGLLPARAAAPSPQTTAAPEPVPAPPPGPVASAAVDPTPAAAAETAAVAPASTAPAAARTGPAPARAEPALAAAAARQVAARPPSRVAADRRAASRAMPQPNARVRSVAPTPVRSLHTRPAKHPVVREAPDLRVSQITVQQKASKSLATPGAVHRPAPARMRAVPRDGFRPAVGHAPAPAPARASEGGRPLDRILLLLAGFCAAAAAIVARVAGRAAPIIDGDELLPDDTDLLRQFDAAYRPRVHHDRCRHPRAPSQAAGGGDLLPHGSRRARGQGGAGSCGGGALAPGLRRSDRARLAQAGPQRQRRARLLHPDDR